MQSIYPVTDAAGKVDERYYAEHTYWPYPRKMWVLYFKLKPVATFYAMAQAVEFARDHAEVAARKGPGRPLFRSLRKRGVLT